MKKSIHCTRITAVTAVVFALGSLAETAQSALKFAPPNAGAPKTRIGGGVRGGLWAPPNAGAPKTRVGGGVRGANLVLPNAGAPKTRIGGGVRGGNWLPPVVGAPKTRVGGGVRGSEEALMSMPRVWVLTPEQTGYTTKASPSLYYHLSEDTELEFEVTVNRSETTLFQARYKRQLKKGINRVSLQQFGVELEEGAEYEWNVALIPNPMQGSLDITSSGAIKRVKAEKKMAGYEAYAENGIWYDMLEDLSDKIDSNPDDKELRKERGDLFKQVGLQEAAQYELGITQG